MKSRNLYFAAAGRQLLVSAAVALAAGLAMTPVASATEDDVVTCSLRTLRGVFDFRASGFRIDNGVAQPKAIIERLVFDGRGNVLTPNVSLSVNGAIIQPPQGAPGVYTVESNCTGTLTFGDGTMFDLHIKPWSKGIDMLQTNPNQVMQGSAARILSLSAWGG